MRMKTRIFATVAAVAVVLCSCVPSVKPFYTKKDLVFERGLIGEWKDPKGDPTAPRWNFEKNEDDNTYRLTLTHEDGATGKLWACLFRLEGNYFLDTIPESWDSPTNQAPLVSASLFPGHMLFRVS